MNRLFILFISLSFILLTNCRAKKQTVTKKTKTTNTNSVTDSQLTNIEVKKIDSADDIVDVLRKENPSLNDRIFNYIETYNDIAISEMLQYRIPASITLAQGILESSSGNGRLAVKANNHFGVKCHKSWKGKRIYHDDDKRQECFRRYDHPISSFRDHSLFLSERKRYAGLFKLKLKNYKGWARGLKKAGYATDPNYPKKLISLIERYQLYEFDKFYENYSGGVTKIDYHGYKDEEQEREAKFIFVKQGDTLYSISKKHNISVNKLKKINNLSSNYLSIGQKIYVE